MWKELRICTRYLISTAGEIVNQRNGRRLIPRDNTIEKEHVYINGNKYSVNRLIAHTFIRNCPRGLKARAIAGAKRYLATSDGHIYSIRSRRMLSPNITNNHGYFDTAIKLDNGTYKKYKIHRAVAETLLAPSKDPDKILVNHIDHNKTNNCLENLEWETYGGNARAYQVFRKQQLANPASIIPKRSIMRISTPT
jgi:hypothetical protein